MTLDSPPLQKASHGQPIAKQTHRFNWRQESTAFSTRPLLFWDYKPGYRCGNCLQPIPRIYSKPRKKPESCTQCLIHSKRCAKHDVYCDDCKSLLCDCGSPKIKIRPSLYEPACRRCLELEGMTFQIEHASRARPGAIGEVEQDLVSTLRTVGRSNWDTIELEIPWLDRRQLHRGMARLIESGRVRRHMIDSFVDFGYHGEEAEFDLVDSPTVSVTNS